MSGVGKDTRLFVSGEIKEAIEAEGWRWKALDAAVRIAMPILLAACGWLFLDVQSAHKERQKLEARVQVIEATRFTRDDASEDRKALADVLSELKSGLSRSEERDKAILKRLDKIEAKLEAPRDR